jgi:hypothetical protein
MILLNIYNGDEPPENWVQGVLVQRVSKNWIYLEFLVYVFMP